MGLINWIFDIYQHSQIDAARREAADARAEITRLNRGGSADGPGVERAVGEVALAIKTLQRMMVEKGLCTHAEFESKLREVDREDGQEDGRTTL